MQNLKDIYHPKPVEIPIGDVDANLFCCGKNEHWELTFPELVHIEKPAGLKFSK